MDGAGSADGTVWAKVLAAAVPTVVMIGGAVATGVEGSHELEWTGELVDEPLNAEPTGLRIDLSGRYMGGEVDGFVQIPKGGEAGTSSERRPTLGELGIDDAAMLDASVTLQWERHIFDAGGRFVRLDSSTTLRRELITHDTTYAPGSRISSEVQLDWYRLGYRYEFLFEADEHGNRLSFAPGIDIVLFDFEYGLDSSAGLHSGRDLLKAGVRVGGVGRWSTGGPLSVEGGAFWGLPFDGTAQIFSLELVGKYRLWGGSGGTSGALYLGVAYDEIEYEDDQTMPNRIEVDMGPLFIAGVEISF